MRRWKASAHLLSLITAILAGQILAPHLDYHQSGMSSFGFYNLTVNNTFYENVEYVYNATIGEPSAGCQDGLVLAVSPSLESPKLAYYGCYVGARHEANSSAKPLTDYEASDSNLVKQEIKNLHFHWFLNGHRFVEVSVSDASLFGVRNKSIVRQLAYNVWLRNGRLTAVIATDTAPSCCMRLPSNSSAASSPTIQTYPQYPLVNTGRHDLTIKGREHKNAPYFYYQKEFKMGAEIPICPDGLKHAIISSSKKFHSGTFSKGCWLSIGFVGSLTLEPDEDGTEATVKRSRLQWMLDGEGVGPISDELWRDANEPAEDWDHLPNGFIGYGRKGLYSLDRSGVHYPCCMYLSPPNTTSAPTTRAPIAATSPSPGNCDWSCIIPWIVVICIVAALYFLFLFFGRNSGSDRFLIIRNTMRSLEAPTPPENS